MMTEVKRLTPYLGLSHDRLTGKSYITPRDDVNANITVSVSSRVLGFINPLFSSDVLIIIYFLINIVELFLAWVIVSRISRVFSMPCQDGCPVSPQKKGLSYIYLTDVPIMSVIYLTMPLKEKEKKKGKKILAMVVKSADF